MWPAKRRAGGVDQRLRVFDTHADQQMNRRRPYITYCYSAALYAGLSCSRPLPRTLPISSGWSPSMQRSPSASTSGWRTRQSTGSPGRGATPIVAGGTGLYLRAAISSLDLPPPPEPGARGAMGSPVRERGPRRRSRLLAGATRRSGPGACQRQAAGRPGSRARGGGRLARTARDSLWGESFRRRRSSSASTWRLASSTTRIQARCRQMLELGRSRRLDRPGLAPSRRRRARCSVSRSSRRCRPKRLLPQSPPRRGGSPATRGSGFEAAGRRYARREPSTRGDRR